MNIFMLRGSDLVRFWSNVETGPTDACWPWRGGMANTGYGCFSLYGKPLIASRVAYQLCHGPIPEGLLIRHACDNPPCCNPWHLSTGTHLDNAKDRQMKGRHAHGYAVHTWKMTEQDVMRIRRSPRVEWVRIAEELGRPYITVYSAAVGRSWKHLPEAVGFLDGRSVGDPVNPRDPGFPITSKGVKP